MSNTPDIDRNHPQEPLHTCKISKLDTLCASVLAGLLGAVTIWIYEAIVWVWLENVMLLAAILINATELLFGKPFQDAIGNRAYLLGLAIHQAFAMG